VPERKELILKRLQDEGTKTAAYFKALQPAQWQQQVYTTGPEWGAHDLLCHFISAERTFIYYSQDLANGGTGVPRDFEIDAFNAREVKALREANHSPAELISTFESQRVETTAFVQALNDSNFDRIGFHPWFGDTSLENILKLLYRHTMLHQRDLTKALETGQPVPHSDFTPPSKQA
jgi:DinB superfamily